MRHLVAEHQRQLVVGADEIHHPAIDLDRLAVGRGVDLGLVDDDGGIIADALRVERDVSGFAGALYDEPKRPVGGLAEERGIGLERLSRRRYRLAIDRCDDIVACEPGGLGGRARRDGDHGRGVAERGIARERRGTGLLLEARRDAHQHAARTGDVIAAEIGSGRAEAVIHPPELVQHVHPAIERHRELGARFLVGRLARHRRPLRRRRRAGGEHQQKDWNRPLHVRPLKDACRARMRL